MNRKILIVGSSGSIGLAFTKYYSLDPNVERIVTLSRGPILITDKKIHSISFDYNDEKTYVNIDEILQLESIDKIVIATGMLHESDIKPEKSIYDININALNKLYKINVFGPMLLIKKLLPLIKKSDAVKIIFLTARVASIADNELGGWYGYRSSKSALNMMIKNLSIELKRISKKHIVIGIHPGTVRSKLSQPFLGHVKHEIFEPKKSVELMGKVIKELVPEDTGKCFDFSGNLIDP